jgi:uncharacterized glyoxalase superfamily protein PhnB
MPDPTVVPALYYQDPKAALAFLEAAFGFEISLCIVDESGKIAHSEMRLGNGRIMVGGLGWYDWTKSPHLLDGVNTQTIHLEVEDVEAHFARAKAAGAAIVGEPEDQFYGARTYRARDPEGHFWSVSQTTREFRPETDMAGTGMSIVDRP